jgi:thioredoxin 1
LATQLMEWQEKDFDAALKTKEITVVEFSAPWCGACKITEPVVAEVANDYPNIKFAKIDVSKNAGLASRMGVMSLPNILFIVDGKVTEQIIGAANRVKIEDKLKKLIK